MCWTIASFVTALFIGWIIYLVFRDQEYTQVERGQAKAGGSDFGCGCIAGIVFVIAALWLLYYFGVRK